MVPSPERAADATPGDGERGADWEAMWAEVPVDLETLEREERSKRWHAQERLVQERFGGFSGLRVIEVGAGRGTAALLYARRGARATLLDTSPLALEQAAALFAREGLEVETVLGDAFALPEALRGAFDVSMSFGLCEHFLGARREAIVAAHLELLRSGGLAMVAVPNRWSPIYRAWMGIQKARGTWILGTEVPFGARELDGLGRRAGGRPLRPVYGSLVATVVDQGLNNVLLKLGRPRVRTPHPSLGPADVLAYDLLVPIVRP